MNATGGYEGAGVGSGGSNSAPVEVKLLGDATIAKAKGGDGASGIGAGYKEGGATSVTIKDGTIISAESEKYGAGIGGGQYGTGSVNVDISGGTIGSYTESSSTISGGAVGGYEGAGIGGGDSATDTTSVSVSGGTVNYACGGEGGAGIGSGYKASGSTSITMTGGALRRITANDCGAGIGGGQSTTGSLTINLTGGSLGRSAGGILGAGIGSSKGASGSLDITLGGTFTADYILGGKLGAGIGSGSGGRLDTVSIGGNCALKYVCAGKDGAGIGAGCEGGGDSSTVVITGGSIFSKSPSYVDAHMENYGAGIGEGKDSSAVAVAISGGDITALSDATYGAGIGGDGSGSAMAKVTITGGTVVARGGGTKGFGLYGWSGGSGIGGTEKNGYDVTITGGTVTGSSVFAGTGIGGGYKGPSGTVNISGGTISATGGSYATGIGSSYKASSCTVNITGGRIYAKGDLGAGIGCGDGAKPGTVNISTSTIAAYGGSGSRYSYPGIDAGDSGKVVIDSGNVMAVSGDDYTGSEVNPAPTNANGEKVGRTLLTVPLSSSGEQKLHELRYRYGDSEIVNADGQYFTQNGGQVYWYLPLREDAASSNLYHATAWTEELYEAWDPALYYTLHTISVSSTAFQNYIFDSDKATPAASDFSFAFGGKSYPGGSTAEGITYDGQAHSATVSATVAGIGRIEAVKYKLDGSDTYTTEAPASVGTYGVYVDLGMSASYDVAYNLKVGTIKIDPSANPVKITSYSSVYDGQSHSVGISDLPETSKVQYSYDQVHWIDEPIAYCKPTVNDSGGEEAKSVWVRVLDSNYQEVLLRGDQAPTVTISKRPITITADSATVTYDGTERSILGGTYVGRADGDDLVHDASTLPYECKGTDAGSYDGKLTGDMAVKVLAEKDHGDIKKGDDVTSCYDIRLVPGKLTIEKARVTVTGASATVVETSAEQVITGCETSGLVSGHALSGLSYSAKGTTVGTYEGSFTGTAVVKDSSGNVKTDNYRVTTVPGTLTIQNDLNYVTATGYSGTYDGKPHSITAAAAQAGNVLWYRVDGADWTTDVSKVSFADAGTHTVQVKGINGSVETKPVSAIVQIDPKPVLADVSIDAQTYTGAALTPAATVKDGTNTLTAGTDYDISNYTDNTNAGTATCTVTLKGNYEGSTTAHFAIKPATVAAPTATAELKYTGSEQTGVAAGAGCTVAGGSATSAGTYTATASLSDKSNTAWTDGTTADKQITWSIAKASASENTVTANAYSGAYDGKAHGIAASSKVATDTTLYYSTDNATWLTTAPTWTDVVAAQTVYVKAVNPNYDDATAYATVTITKATLTATYTGDTIGFGETPALVVKVSGWVNNESAATAASYVAPTVDATGVTAVGAHALTPTGGSATNYDFSNQTGTLTINAKILTEDDIQGQTATKTYTGSAITLNTPDDIEIDVDGKTLKYGADYEIVADTYRNNVNVGTGTFTLKFMGNYAVKDSADGTMANVPGLFIDPADASGATVTGAEDKTYTGNPIEQTLTVKLGTTTLTPGTDYKVTYADNTEVGTAGYTVEYTGNYTASTSGTFQITPADASKSVIGISPQTYTGSAIEPALVVIAPGGRYELEKGADYDVVFSDNVDAGTATAKLTFKGDYKGTASCTFEIAPAAVGVPAVATGLTYTGSEQTGVSAGDLYTVAGGSAADAGSYTATVSLKDKKNTAWTDGTTVDKVVVWSIAPADASAATVSGIDAGYTYTGSPIEPAPTVTLDGKTLVAGTDYTVSYADNTDPGTAAWTVAFIGNYASAKPITGTFAIAKVRKAQMDAPDGVTQKGLDQVLAAASAAQSDVKSIDVELIIIDANPLDADAKAVQSALVTAGLKPGALYNAFLGKVVDGTLTDIGSSNDVLVGVTYPFDFADKDQVRVFVRHGGQTYELTTAPNAHGEYIALDRSAGTVTVYAKRYSTFGIGYTEAAVSPATPAPASAAPASDRTASSTAATGDAMLPWAVGLAALVLAAAGGIVLAVRRRRADGPSRGARPRR